METLQAIVAARIRQVREQRQLTQERAAQLLGIDRARLSGMENASRPIDIPMLARLAQVYGVSMRDFITESEPEQTDVNTQRTDNRGVGSVLLRATAQHSLPEIPSELHGVEKFARRFTHLIEQLDATPPAADLPRWEADNDLPKSRLEGYAHHLKNTWGIDDTPIAPRIFALLDEKGIPVYREPLLDATISGAYWDVPTLGSLIFVNAKDIPYRQAFTAAHELAHALFHHPGVISYKRQANLSMVERFANEFASVLLMPAADIDKCIVEMGIGRRITPEDVVVLHRHFGVSYAAMLVRLKKLRLIQDTQYRQYKEERPVSLALQLGYAVKSWEFNYDPDEADIITRLRWLPRHYVRLVRQANDVGVLSDRQAASYLNVDFEAWEGLLLDERDSAHPPEDFEDAETIIA